MSLATLSPNTVVTMADLLDALGNIPLERIRMQPPPGMATEDDVIAIHAREKRLCELVDGVLVEKTMGFEESRLALEIGYILVGFLRNHDLGVAAGADGMMRLAIGLVRIPDVSFVSWNHLPERLGPIPLMAPDLAIEVLSESNTRAEMARKLNEYFAAGAQLVWYFDLKARTVTVYTAPDQATVLGESDLLDGGTVLPGLVIPLRELFDRASRRRGPEA